MITLYQFHPVYGLPNASPFCLKVECYLRMAEIDHELRYTDNLGLAPKGKFPFILDDKRKLADSGFILEHLSKKFSVRLDDGLSAKELAVAHAFRGMIEERLYFAIFHSRWAQDENWKHVRRAFFGRLLFPLNLIVPYIARRSVLRDLKGQGIGRHSVREVDQLAIQDLRSISDFLGAKPYFMGSQPTSIDSVVYAFLANIIIPEIPSRIKKEAESRGNLVDYVSRMTERYFPDFLESINQLRHAA